MRNRLFLVLCKKLRSLSPIGLKKDMKKSTLTFSCFFVMFCVTKAYGAPLCNSTQAGADTFTFPVEPPSGYYDAQKFLEYNSTVRKYHLGEDWNGSGGGSSDYGNPVLAVANGTVTYVSDLGGSWGKVITVRHDLPDGCPMNSLYGHLSRVLVKEGDPVQRGCQIGDIGDADGYYAGSAHLHLELRVARSMEREAGHGYVTSLAETATIADYTDPTRFIQGRLISSVFSFTRGWNSVSHNFTNAANSNSGWVDYRGARFSVAGAVDASLIYYLAYQWVNGAWRTFDFRTGTFNPTEIYWIYSCSNDVAFTTYGQYDLDQQAFKDMVARAAKDSRFGTVITSTFGKMLDWDVDWALRWINFSFTGGRVVAMYHATYKDNPTVRFTIFWDPTAGKWIGWDQAW